MFRHVRRAATATCGRTRSCSGRKVSSLVSAAAAYPWARPTSPPEQVLNPEQTLDRGILDVDRHDLALFNIDMDAYGDTELDSRELLADPAALGRGEHAG
jgi:hypothetical protein